MKKQIFTLLFLAAFAGKTYAMNYHYDQNNSTNQLFFIPQPAFIPQPDTLNSIPQSNQLFFIPQPAFIPQPDTLNSIPQPGINNNYFFSYTSNTESIENNNININEESNSSTLKPAPISNEKIKHAAIIQYLITKNYITTNPGTNNCHCNKCNKKNYSLKNITRHFSTIHNIKIISDSNNGIKEEKTNYTNQDLRNNTKLLTESIK